MSDDRSLPRRTARTMSDIARLAGVSEATVSRALADSPLVNPDTRDRIRRIAEAENYVLNTKARNLRLKRTGTIAVVIPLDSQLDQPISDPFFMELVGSIADALNGRGFDLLLSRVDAGDKRWTSHLRDTTRADGSIVIGQSTQHDTLNRLEDEGLPFVVWGGRMADQRYCTVGCDNVLGGTLATEHLLAGGRRRIAFFGDRILPEVALRHSGYVAALDAARVARDSALEFRARFAMGEARKAVSALLESDGAADAIFATSDVLAMAAIKALNDEGVSVPDDIAVVGFDDISLAQWYNPPLTTMRQHIAQGGRLLVDLLMARIAGETITPIMLTPELVVRGSSGA